MSEQPQAEVRITVGDIYRQLITLTSRIDTSLARAEQVERTLAEHEADLRPLAGAHDKLVDHEARLRSIERTRWPLTSLTVLLGLASLGVAVAVALTR